MRPSHTPVIVVAERRSVEAPACHAMIGEVSRRVPVPVMQPVNASVLSSVVLTAERIIEATEKLWSEVQDLMSTSDHQGDEMKDLESTLDEYRAVKSMRDCVTDMEGTDMQRLKPRECEMETATLHLTELKDWKAQLRSEITEQERVRRHTVEQIAVEETMEVPV